MAGRVVIITGGARGIGFACVERFLNDGYRVMLADRDEHAGQEAVSTLDKPSSQLSFLHCDVSDRLSVHNLVAETLTLFGQIDVLINNAGIVAKGGALDVSEDDFDRVMAVNLRGAFLVSRAVALHMVEALDEADDRSGLRLPNYNIINITSINAKVAIADNLAYNVSKGGMNQLTRSMALELAPKSIRVNAIGPGSVRTNMLASVADDETAMNVIHSRTPLGRIAQPSEIASVAAFLAGDDASYVTGEIIYVDGGRLALNYVMPPRDVEGA